MQFYEPILFSVIAQEVVRGCSEQYLIATADGDLAVMLPTQAIQDAITEAKERMRQHGGGSVIASEYRGSTDVSDPDFSDECDGLIFVDGVLVEVSIRKLSDGMHRVLFSRVDAYKLYSDVVARLNKLEHKMACIGPIG